MSRKENISFMIGFTITTLFLCGVLYFNNTEKEQEETITVIAEVDDVLSASNYKGEQIYTLSNNREFLGNFQLTAYCGCWNCSEGYGNGTATGTIAQPDQTIAVDPEVIPYGSTVYIDGNMYVAEDCGGAIVGNRIDIYHSTHKEAVEFGVQYADVWLSEVR